MLPCDDMALRAEVTQRDTYEVHPTQYLQYDVEKLLSKLINKELQFAIQVEGIKQDLASWGVEERELFYEIDHDRSHYIDKVNLKQFLMRNAYLPNDNLILAIIRRIDLDCDAQLNPGEFMDAIRPNEDVQVQSRSRSKPRSAIKTTTIH